MHDDLCWKLETILSKGCRIIRRAEFLEVQYYTIILFVNDYTVHIEYTATFTKKYLWWGYPPTFIISKYFCNIKLLFLSGEYFLPFCHRPSPSLCVWCGLGMRLVLMHCSISKTSLRTLLTIVNFFYSFSDVSLPSSGRWSCCVGTHRPTTKRTASLWSMPGFSQRHCGSSSSMH